MLTVVAQIYAVFNIKQIFGKKSCQLFQTSLIYLSWKIASMPQAVINIEGQIGHSYNEDGSVAVSGVTIQSIAAQIAQAPADADSFNVIINSPGGNVELGKEIAKMVKALPNCTTEAVNQCASIATLIFCAVPKENRFIAADCLFGIHNPLFANISGDAATLKAAAAALEPIQKELLNNYVEATGAPKQVLQSMMNVETILTAEEAVALGFAGSVIEKTPALGAVAFLDIANNTNMDTKTKGFLARIKQVAANMVGSDEPDPNAGRNVVALMIETDQGTINTPFSDLVVGDPVTMEDGSPAPDGTYTATDGMQIVVVGGAISEIVPVAGGDLQAQVVALQAQLDTALAEIAELQAGVETANTVIAQLEARAIRSTHKPAATAVATFANASRTQEPEKKVVVTKDAMADRRASYKTGK